MATQVEYTDEHERRLIRLEETIKLISTGLDRLVRNDDEIMKALGRIEAKLASTEAKLEGKIASVEAKLAGVEAKVDEKPGLWAILVLQVAVVGVLLGGAGGLVAILRYAAGPF